MYHVVFSYTNSDASSTAIVSKNKKSSLFLKAQYKTMLGKEYNNNKVYFERNKITLSIISIY